MRGSKHELKFDYKGQPINEEEIRNILKKKSSAGAVKNGKVTAEEEKMDLS